MKNPLTPAGIEPTTFRYVAQHLNHCATAVPNCVSIPYCKCNFFVSLLTDASHLNASARVSDFCLIIRKYCIWGSSHTLLFNPARLNQNRCVLTISITRVCFYLHLLSFPSKRFSVGPSRLAKVLAWISRLPNSTPGIANVSARRFVMSDTKSKLT